MAINIIAEKCKACGLCVKECPFQAMSLVEADGKKVAEPGMGCTNCGVCVTKCPFNAIERTGTSMVNVDITQYHGVWVYAEQRGGKLMNVVIELLGEGRKLADAIGTELCAVLVGSLYPASSVQSDAVPSRLLPLQKFRLGNILDNSASLGRSHSLEGRYHIERTQFLSGIREVLYPFRRQIYVLGFQLDALAALLKGEPFRSPAFARDGTSCIQNLESVR